MTTNCEACTLTEGYAVLRAGRADEARRLFTAAVERDGSAEAHEGLSWAALALDDGAATIAARQEAYRLYRATGAQVAAARMAMWLAKDHDDFRGEAALANGWLARVRRLLEDQPTAPEHGWLPVLECWGTTASERDPEAVAKGARQAITVARQCGDRDLELLGIGFEGLALVDAGRVEDGMARLDEAAAAATAGELDEPLWALVVFCNLIFACERVRDFARAAEWCATMRDQADRMRHIGSQGICRAHYGAVLTQCGDWAGAEEALAEAVRYFEASWPPYRAEALADLAELLAAPDQFRPGPPPALDSERYAEEFAEVKRLGGKDSAERSDEQTHIGYWWAEYSTVGYPDFARAHIAENDTHLWPAARLFALLAVDNFDALVSAWDAKYEYAYWRPHTAIHAAADDGNPATSADPDWEPEMTTPPHPDYPAALSTLCAGGAEILKDAFGTDVAFTRASGSAPEDMPATRHYDTLDAAVESCMLSRIYNGFHFRSGLEAGVEMGRARAAHILDTQLVRRSGATGIAFPD